MSAKTKKKKNQQVLSLGEFLDSTPSAPQVSSWAEEMERVDGGSSDVDPGNVAAIRAQLPTAPKSAQALDIPDEKIPKSKPFRVYISSVSFEADEEMVRKFFAPLKVENVHLVKNERGTGHRGFGYVDFDDRDSLIDSLGKNDTKLHTRNVRISLDEPKSERTHHHHQLNAPLKSDEANWRRSEPEPEVTEPEHQFRSYQGNVTRSRGGYQASVGRGSANNRRGGFHQRQSGGDDEGSNQRRPPFNKPRGGGERHYHNRENRERREPSAEHQQHDEEAPLERPKLHLQPRSKPIEPVLDVAQASSSIFGGAKPVDTAARERAIEEKLRAERDEARKAAAEVGEQSEKNEEQGENEPDTVAIDEHQHKSEEKMKERRQQHEPQQFYQAAKAKHYQHDGNNNTRVTSGTRRGGYKQSGTDVARIVKSPSSDSNAWHKKDDDNAVGGGDEAHTRPPHRTFNRERRGGGVGGNNGGKERRGGGSGAGKFGNRAAERGGDNREKRRPPPRDDQHRDQAPALNVNNKFASLNIDEGMDEDD